jgi:predicted acylesterase/phospholipase RssA
MSISIVQKSDLSKPKRHPRVALVLAGGAVSGGAFKLGGLIALNRFLRNRKVTDFDLYVGVSAGALIGSFLSAGFSPEELLRGIDGRSLRLNQLKVYDFYWPAWGEYVSRTGRLLRDAVTIWPAIGTEMLRHLGAHNVEVKRRFLDFLARPGYGTLERVIGPLVSDMMRGTPIPQAGRYLPAGLFETSRLEQFVRTNFARNHVPNDFRILHRERGNSLYIAASNLNTAMGTVFGHDMDHTASISEAVQASVAIPGFYVPVKIRGEEYLDGQIRKTASASFAMHKGANLIILYNPLRPFMNRSRYQLKPTVASLSDMGFVTVVDQAVRTMLQTRLYLGLEKLKLDPDFTGDLILIEPTETDAEFFSMNPLSFWNRGTAARHGFNSVRRSLERNATEIQRILSAYGLESDLTGLESSLGEAPVGDRQATEPSVEPAAKPAHRPRLSVVK